MIEENKNHINDSVDENQDLQKMANEIISYLDSNPNASDTLNGVANWWIMQQRYRVAITEVQLVLDYLCKKNMLGKTPDANGSYVYGIVNKEKNTENKDGL